jgi:hypothetical protein
MAEQGIGPLTKETIQDARRFFTLEMKLISESVKAQMGKKVAAGGAGAMALFLLVIGVLFGLAAAAAGLALVLPWWAALLVMCGALFLVAGVLGAVAAAGLRKGGGLVSEQVRNQVKEDMQWLREQTS